MNKLVVQQGVIGLIQGLWLYWASNAWTDHESLVPLLAGGIYFLLVAGTSLQIFQAPSQSDWLRSIALGAVYGLLAAWVFSFSELVPYLAGDHDRKFSLLVAGIFVFLFSLPLCRKLREPGSYFSTLWEGFFWIVIALVFTGLCWAFLSVWAGLFRMLEVEWFHELFFSETFGWLASPVMLSMGFFLQINRGSVAHSLGKLTGHFFRIMNPFICVLVITFAAALLLKYCDILFKEVEITSAYVGLLLFLYIAINALVEDKASTNAKVLWLSKAALFLSPVILLLLMLEQWQVIATEGLMPAPYWNMVLFCWLMVIALSYLGVQAANWVKRADNFKGLDALNGKLVYFTLFLFILVHVPPFDVLRMSAWGQSMQVIKGEATKIPLSKFRCELGYYGDAALRRLEATASAPETLAEIKDALSRETCFDSKPLVQFERFKTIPEGMQISDSLKNELTERFGYYLVDCNNRLENQCILASVELPGDVSAFVLISTDSSEIAVFNLITPTGINSIRYDAYHSETEQIGRQHFIHILEAGDLNWIKPKHYDLQIEGKRYIRRP